MTSPTPLTTKNEILPLAKQLLEKVSFSATRAIRLIGLGVGCSEENKNTYAKWKEMEIPFNMQ